MARTWWFHLRALLFATLLCVQAAGSAAPGAEVAVGGAELRHAGEFVVAVDKSTVLKIDTAFKQIFVGNDKIADVMALTDRSIYVLGKKVGTTSLTVYGPNRRLIAVADLVVSYDVDGLKRRLHDVMPDETIEVRQVNGSIMLSGRVTSGVLLSRALAIAQQFAPDKVTNALTLRGSQQVMLSVRFAEVARRVIKQLGMNSQVRGNDFAVSAGDTLRRGAFSALSFLTGSATFGIGSVSLDFLFDALEDKGVVKTLAEPNLIALSGDTASFLAGGEFPVPVAQQNSQGGTTITVEFKQFGVSLSFTPTVLDNGLINILAAPEVSKIDPNNSVKANGFEIPGLTTRRARTTVELRSGQSFAIAGLIQSDFQDTVRQVPGLGEVPIISALARSTDFQRNETELVIIVTAHLVKPAPAGSLKAPTDSFVPPSDGDIVLRGRNEAADSGLVRGRGVVGPLELQGAGGIVGSYGHIIR